MRLRSLLFVPGDRPERMAKALSFGADALILDLEDSVSTASKPAAREAVVEFLARPRSDMALFVRVNPLDGDEIEADLDALSGARLDGVMLPKAEGAASVEEVSGRLSARGVQTTGILPVATETPAAVFQLGTYASVADKLHGVTWGAEDLPAAIGAASAREADGRYTAPYELARSLTLFAAAAAGVRPIETVYPDFRDVEGLAAYARKAARDGFTGMMAIHPSQIAIINDAFSPSGDALAAARSIVAAFDSRPGSGVLQIDGRMVDAPHLKQARRLLEQAGQGG
jgi:citrate lyase subunit beta/citryl-CoA lyase